MMKVTVHLHTILQRQTADGPQRRLDVELLSGSTVSNLQQDLGVDLPLDALLLVVNGRLVEPAQVLQDGDHVHFMPAISGG
jgi:molybdopterin converting factor small subunit